MRPEDQPGEYGRQSGRCCGREPVGRQKTNRPETTTRACDLQSLAGRAAINEAPAPRRGVQLRRLVREMRHKACYFGARLTNQEDEASRSDGNKSVDQGSPTGGRQ